MRLLSTKGVERINQKWDSLIDLAAINGCSDEFTNLPIDAIEHEFSVGENYEHLVVTFSTTIMVLVAVPLLTVILVAC